nr:type II toxin-antitoxin system RelE/ParE family toxin [uncultured Flavobacterium sp.]
MAPLEVFWTPTALRQRNIVFEYWNERNQSYEYSKKLYSKITERTNLLKINPEMGKKTIFNDNRAISLGHYSIFYQFDTKIIITAFWDNRQDPTKLLKSLRK